jgi:hypothetical protein
VGQTEGEARAEKEAFPAADREAGDEAGLVLAQQA